MIRDDTIQRTSPRRRLMVLAFVLLGLGALTVFCYLFVFSAEDVAPVKGLATRIRSIPWTTRAETVLMDLLTGQGGENAAGSIQSITHPSGSAAHLGKPDINIVGDELSVTLTTNWHGGVSGSLYTTVVVWEFNEHQHLRTSILSDNAPFAVEPANLKQLDEYFRTQMYATLRDNMTRFESTLR